MKFSELYKLLEKNGWECTKGGKHYKYVHKDYKYFVPVGRHKSHEVPPGTLEKILKETGLK